MRPFLGIGATQRVTQKSAPFSLASAYDSARESTLQNNLRLQLGVEIGGVTASAYLCAAFGVVDASFWKRGSFRSGSNIGSSRSRAGVSGTFEASELS